MRTTKTIRHGRQTVVFGIVAASLLMLAHIDAAGLTPTIFAQKFLTIALLLNYREVMRLLP
jgi:hypothetical protein